MIPAEDFLKELLMHRGDCSFCTKLLQKDLFTKEKFPVGALNEDFHLLVKLLTDEENIVPGIACIPGQTYHVFTARTATPEIKTGSPECSRTTSITRIWYCGWWRRDTRS